MEFSYSELQEDILFNWAPELKFKIIRKGRRAGITHGVALGYIDLMLQGTTPLLWGDTINGNIDRYFDRYFLPCLKRNKIKFKFDKMKKQLTIGDCYCDFRSSDNPENWEGFGYKFIFLNEAGIILKNRYLYTNAVLPMLMDYPDSKLIAAGVPKGKFLRDGTEHPFYTLHKRAEEGHVQYQSMVMTAYDSPFMNDNDVRDLEKEIAILNPAQVQQEIYGEFIEMSGDNPFMTCYDINKHESASAVFNPNKQLRIILDFNLNPFSAIIAHIWRDSEGEHCHIFDELEIKAGSTHAIADILKLKYSKQLSSCLITGDSMGNRGDISQRDNATLYVQLIRLLNIRQSQLQVPANPTHENSREQCNYVLHFFNDFKINPVTCPNTCRDMKIVQCDSFGSIIKSNRKEVSQRADYLDNVRYIVNTWLTDWIKRHRK